MLPTAFYFELNPIPYFINQIVNVSLTKALFQNCLSVLFSHCMEHVGNIIYIRASCRNFKPEDKASTKDFELILLKYMLSYQSYSLNNFWKNRATIKFKAHRTSESFAKKNSFAISNLEITP